MAKYLPIWLKGNTDAIAFVMAMHGIAELWDDLIDKDKGTSAADINLAFYTALIVLPRNRFYTDHFNELNPILDLAIVDWMTANVLEKKADGNSLTAAYFLRHGALGLTIMAAKIIGGVAWAVHVDTEMRGMGEALPAYIKEIGDS